MKRLIATLVCGILGWAHAALPIEHWRSPEGAQIYLMHSPALPIVDVQVDWDAGTARDPAGKAGTAEALALMLEKGVQAHAGQPALDENALAEAWIDLAAQHSFSAGADRFSASLRSLSRDDVLPAAVTLLAQQLAQPSLPAAIWQRERSKWQASLQEAATRPPFIAQRAYSQAVYGQHPYGQATTEASLARISTADLRQHAQQHLLPCRARISMVGAIDRTQAERISQQLLASLPQHCPALAELPPTPKAPVQTQHIEKDAAQSQVLMGQIAIERSSPHFFPMLVGNHILGAGGFASLLMEEVREKNGLVYGIYSDFNPLRQRGAFSISFQTRPEEAQRAVALTQKVLDQFVQHGPSPQALQAAKDNLIGGFPGRMDSNAKLLSMLSNIAWNDLPLDYLEHWTERVAAVTAQDIQQAFAELGSKNLLRVQVGPKVAAAEGEENTSQTAAQP